MLSFLFGCKKIQTNEVKTISSTRNATTMPLPYKRDASTVQAETTAAPFILPNMIQTPSKSARYLKEEQRIRKKIIKHFGIKMETLPEAQVFIQKIAELATNVHSIRKKLQKEFQKIGRNKADKKPKGNLKKLIEEQQEKRKFVVKTFIPLTQPLRDKLQITIKEYKKCSRELRILLLKKKRSREVKYRPDFFTPKENKKHKKLDKQTFISKPLSFPPSQEDIIFEKRKTP